MNQKVQASQKAQKATCSLETFLLTKNKQVNAAPKWRIALP